jgi:hypothetical protein
MTARPAIALAAFLATISLLAAACGLAPRQCTEMGCTSGPNIQFTETDLADGDWRVELLESERPLGTCTITLPAAQTYSNCEGPFHA